MFLFLYETHVGSLEMFEFEVDDASSLVYWINLTQLELDQTR